jgi:hypothetical protein
MLMAKLRASQLLIELVTDEVRLYQHEVVVAAWFALSTLTPIVISGVYFATFLPT